ncbi:hypothetical protein FACS189419_04750 [Planctomycetales bacterium]|nr:hypothetical protein FACS189419_04750 [Planctomycetales bacterium]
MQTPKQMKTAKQMKAAMKELIDAAAWNAAASDDPKHLKKLNKMLRVAFFFARNTGNKKLEHYFKHALTRAEKKINAEGPCNHDLFDLSEF